MKKVASLQSSHDEQSIVEVMEMIGILNDAGMTAESHPLLKSLISLIVNSPTGNSNGALSSLNESIIDVIYAATTTSYIDNDIHGKL